MKSLYKRAMEWSLASMTPQEEKDLDRVRLETKLHDDYQEGLVLGYLAGYRAGKADAERASKRKKRGAK